MAAYDPKEDDYGDGDIPEVDTEPYKDGFYVERIEVSGMNIAVYYRGGDKDWFVVWATDKNGVRTGVPMGMMSAGAEDGLNLGLWSFETPAALDELASVTLLGETFPLE